MKTPWGRIVEDITLARIHRGYSPDGWTRMRVNITPVICIEIRRFTDSTMLYTIEFGWLTRLWELSWWTRPEETDD